MGTGRLGDWGSWAKLLLIMCVLFSACDSPTVPERLLRDVYEFRLVTPARKTLRWPSGSTINVFVAQDIDANLNQFLKEAVPHGMQVWNSAALYGETRIQETSDVANADVVVMYSLSQSPVELSGCPPGGGSAFTTFCLANDDEHLRPFPLTGGAPSRVKFVITVRTTSASDAATVRRLVAHELGHMLGIAQHSIRPTDLMFGGVTLSRDDPSPSDRATLQVLYRTVPDITP